MGRVGSGWWWWVGRLDSFVSLGEDGVTVGWVRLDLGGQYLTLT